MSFPLTAPSSSLEDIWSRRLSVCKDTAHHSHKCLNSMTGLGKCPLSDRINTSAPVPWQDGAALFLGWLAYVRENPRKDNWVSMQEYMQSQFAPLDKSAEAKKRFKGQRIAHESEKAMQAYSSIQVRNITKMGAESSFSSKGIWDQFLLGLPEALLRSTANIYANELAAYDALSPVSKISKPQEKLMPQLRAQRASQRNLAALAPTLL